MQSQSPVSPAAAVEGDTLRVEFSGKIARTPEENQTLQFITKQVR